MHIKLLNITFYQTITLTLTLINIILTTCFIRLRKHINTCFTLYIYMYISDNN